MNDRPKSWWRTLLGYKAIMVVDAIDFGLSEIKPLYGWYQYQGARGKVVEHHYEWQWSPFRKKRSWISGPWTRFK